MTNLYKLLYEAEEAAELANQDVSVGDKTRLAKDSLDDQIDSLLIGFEESAVEDEDDIVSEERIGKLEYLLYEAPEDEEQADKDDEDDNQEAEGSEKIDVEEAAEEKPLNINIDRFAASVARLIKNADSLLNLEAVILNRVKNYLKEKNYDESYTERLLDILEVQHDIKAIDNLRDYNDNPPEHDAPLGMGAYDGGSGGGGA